VDRLAAALESLEAKLQFPDGIDGLSAWIDRVSAVIGPVSLEAVERARNETRALIDRLLELNAEVQNLVRLKQLLS
jgi:uncharacterized membrane-anchored protein